MDVVFERPSQLKAGGPVTSYPVIGSSWFPIRWSVGPTCLQAQVKVSQSSNILHLAASEIKIHELTFCEWLLINNFLFHASHFLDVHSFSLVAWLGLFFYTMEPQKSV